MKGDKIVVIEDEADILDVIAHNLTREGFRVVCAQTGEAGLREVRQEAPALVILDLMLPGLDGIEVCRLLKLDPVTRPIPIIIATAKGEESDVVLGLGVGADDYVIKPFSPKELMARVKAVLRRGRLRPDGQWETPILRDGLLIDAQRHEVRVDGEPMTLTATEFRLLHFLASHPGRVFRRPQLLSRVISEDAIVIDRNVDVHVGSIRRKLGPHRELIETVRGVGYRFRD